MKVNDYIRMLAGAFVIVTVLLAKIHSGWWLLLTVFIGLNLFQSAFTKWCPAMSLLRKLGVPD
jgi:hypothetical protein